MRSIKYGWVIENTELSGRRSISTPKYLSIDTSSVNENRSGPYVKISIKLAINFLYRLSMMQSSTYTNTMISEELSMELFTQKLLVLAMIYLFYGILMAVGS